jgi:PAS domain S-box-containing protein
MTVRSPPSARLRKRSYGHPNFVTAGCLKPHETGYFLLDAASRRITDTNPYMVELLGFSRDELIRKELWEIGLLTDTLASQDAFRELERKGYIRYEHLPLRTTEGKTREVEFVSNVYREDGHQVIQCNVRDITDRKHAEELVHKTNDELMALVAELQRRDREMQLLNHDGSASGLQYAGGGLSRHCDGGGGTLRRAERLRRDLAGVGSVS